jgi:hypothetical protein
VCRGVKIAARPLGKLAGHGYGIRGYCLVCQRVFLVSLPALIKKRGSDARVAGMRPLVCPGCSGRCTQYRIIAPSKVGG